MGGVGVKMGFGTLDTPFYLLASGLILSSLSQVSV